MKPLLHLLFASYHLNLMFCAFYEYFPTNEIENNTPQQVGFYNSKSILSIYLKNQLRNQPFKFNL